MNSAVSDAFYPIRTILNCHHSNNRVSLHAWCTGNNGSKSTVSQLQKMFDINELLWCLTSKQPEKKSSSVSSRPTAPLSLNHANAFHLPKSSCSPLRLHIAPLQAQHSACPRQESQLQHQTTFRVLNLFLPTCSTNCTYILKASPGSHLLSTSGVTWTPLSLYPFTPWPEATGMEMQGDVGGSRTLGRTSLPAEQTPLFLWPMKKRAEELIWPTLPLFCP